jgi:hypothetical protein
MTEGTITAWKKKEGKPKDQDSLVLSARVHFSDLDVMVFLSFGSQTSKGRGYHSFRDTNFTLVNFVDYDCFIGDSVVAGDVLLEIETDKAGMDVEAVEDGILAKILASFVILGHFVIYQTEMDFRFLYRAQEETNTLLHSILSFSHFPRVQDQNAKRIFGKN